MSTLPDFDEETKRSAYMKGLQLKQAGLDAETIYARLEKQGFHPDLAKQVAWNVVLQRQKENLDKLPVSGFGSGGGIARLFHELAFWKKKSK